MGTRSGVRTVRWKVWHPTMKDCPGSHAGLSDAESILSDICRSISDYMDEMEFSGEDFKKTEERLDLDPLELLAKYG